MLKRRSSGAKRGVASKAVHKGGPKDPLLIGARKLLKSKGKNIRFIEKKADKYKPFSLSTKTTGWKSWQQKKDRLVEFAMVYAHYVIVAKRSSYNGLVKSCAQMQDMTVSPRGNIPTALLRCLMGYPKASVKKRNQQRQYIWPVSRSIANLMMRGIAPDEVAAMMPGKGVGTRAWSSLTYSQRGTQVPSPRKPVRLPGLNISGKIGRHLILRGQLVGKGSIEISDWAPVGLYAGQGRAAEKLWMRIKAQAQKIGPVSFSSNPAFRPTSKTW